MEVCWVSHSHGTVSKDFSDSTVPHDKQRYIFVNSRKVVCYFVALITGCEDEMADDNQRTVHRTQPSPITCLLPSDRLLTVTFD